MTTLTGASSFPTVNVRALRTPLQFVAGFFIAFRICITYLGFQSDPRAGTIVNLACGGLLLAAALFVTLGDEQFSMQPIRASRILRWLFAYLAVSGLSLFWTAAASVVDTAGQWTGMAMQVATVVLLIRKPHLPEKVDALLKGFVIGMLFVALVAWLSPRTEDLRLGDTDFLHPNILGMNCAIAFFLAQYLALRKPAWKWCCLALGITLIRTFSKTSIIAFLLAESFYLLREKQISRSMKIKIVIVSAIILAAFATLTQAYLTGYTEMEGGNPTETLTGRTLVWSFASTTGIERPWIGHGVYSFRTLIPGYGNFQPWAAHNEVLQEFFEYGLLGVVVTAGLYLSLFRAARRSPSIHYRGLVFVLLLFVLIHGLTESLNFDLTFPLWLAAAVALLWTPPPEVASS